MDIGVKDGYAFQTNTYNIILGGLANTLNTAELIASKFSFAASDIKKLTFINNDIYFFINVEFLVIDSAFNNNEDITFFIDNTGKLTQIRGRSFRGSSIKEFHTNSQALLFGAAFEYSDLEIFEAYSVIRLQRGAFQRATKLYKAIIPQSTIGLLQFVFFQCFSLLEVDISSMTFTEANGDSFSSFPNDGIIRLPSVYQGTNQETNLISKNWQITYT